MGPGRLHRHVAQRQQPVRHRHVCILPGVPQLSSALKCFRSSKSEILAMTVAVMVLVAVVEVVDVEVVGAAEAAVVYCHARTGFRVS